MTFQFQCYTIDPARRELRRSGELVHVEPQVFDVLVYLIENRDRVVSKDELFANVWNGRVVSETTLSSRVNAARRAIGDTGSRQALIQTVAKRGFRFLGEIIKKQAAASERFGPNAEHSHGAELQMIEHALANNPSSAHAHAVGAVVNAWAGRYDIAVDLAERALRLSPFDPARHLALAALARSRLFQDNPSAALAAARRAVQASPGHLPSHGYLIISIMRLGLTQELSTAAERLLANVPRASVSQFSEHVIFHPFMKELSAAGLPP